MMILFNEAIARAMRDDPYIPPVPETSVPLTLTAVGSTPSEVIDMSVALTANGSVNWSYEVDTGKGWMDYTYGTSIPLANGQSCKWRCKTVASPQSTSNYVNFQFSGASGNIIASGNCNSMLLHDFESLTSLEEFNYAFFRLFKDCQALVRAPKLPATTLSDNCYHAMFFGCTSLTQVPELPATTLTQYCYDGMFFGCTSLTQASELPATTLSFNCCWAMFKGCTSLTKAPELPVTTLAPGCYDSMFADCTSLTQAPELPATNLITNCYEKMFDGCSSLTEVRIKATSTATNALKGWLTHVSASGTVYANPDFGLAVDSPNGVPSGWVRANINDYPTT